MIIPADCLTNVIDQLNFYSGVELQTKNCNKLKEAKIEFSQWQVKVCRHQSFVAALLQSETYAILLVSEPVNCGSYTP